MSGSRRFASRSPVFETLEQRRLLAADVPAPTIADLVATPDPVSRSQKVTLQATGVATEVGAVTGVDFYFDKNSNGVIDKTDPRLGRDTKAAGGWSAAVATKTLPAGNVQVLARATNAARKTSAPVAVTFTVTNAAPTLAAVATSPKNSVEQGKTVTLSVNRAVDSDGKVVRVDYYVDQDDDNVISEESDVPLGSVTNRGFKLKLSTSEFDTGSFTILARAADNDGGVSNTVRTTLAITRAGGAPDITSFRASRSSVSEFDDFQLIAAVKNRATVDGVSFFIDANDNGIFDFDEDEEIDSDLDGSDGFTLELSASDFDVGSLRFFAIAFNDFEQSRPKSTTVRIVASPTDDFDDFDDDFRVFRL